MKQPRTLFGTPQSPVPHTEEKKKCVSEALLTNQKNREVFGDPQTPVRHTEEVQTKIRVGTPQPATMKQPRTVFGTPQIPVPHTEET